ncbi:LysR family transcriptional regulator [Pseudaestuariivita rosea]|uniref:LysR family transcriptional regulator n=1 Tax=Pseudaestuariivita rosea TaxID=2763263 RepID=UPI001ABAD4E8|nr:LysR family transcriptional regulator [Pseudaestuariivita rosea]
MSRIRLDHLDIFAQIVRHGGFRAAAADRGVSSSVMSQTMTALERTLGIRLLNRTTRSVAVTEAGARLLEGLAPALEEIRLAVDELDRLRETPSGTLRINAPEPAAYHVLCPLALDFMATYPEVSIEIASDAAIIDIVAQGFDAGVRFGNQIAQDMIALPVGPPLRYAIVASPDYLAGRPAPKTPADLSTHECIRRRYPGGALAKWAFEKDGDAVEFLPSGRFTVGSAQLELRAAISGHGIAHLLEDYAIAALAEGSLVQLLSDWSPTLPSWHLYYSNRRHSSAAMQAFIAFVRRSTHRQGETKSSLTGQ